MRNLILANVKGYIILKMYQNDPHSIRKKRYAPIKMFICSGAYNRDICRKYCDGMANCDHNKPHYWHTSCALKPYCCMVPDEVFIEKDEMEI